MGKNDLPSRKWQLAPGPQGNLTDRILGIWLTPHLGGEDWRAPQRGVMEPRAHTDWSGSGRLLDALLHCPSSPQTRLGALWGRSCETEGEEEERRRGRSWAPLGQDPELFAWREGSTSPPVTCFFKSTFSRPNHYCSGRLNTWRNELFVCVLVPRVYTLNVMQGRSMYTYTGSPFLFVLQPRGNSYHKQR